MTRVFTGVHEGEPRGVFTRAPTGAGVLTGILKGGLTGGFTGVLEVILTRVHTGIFTVLLTGVLTAMLARVLTGILAVVFTGVLTEIHRTNMSIHRSTHRNPHRSSHRSNHRSTHRGTDKQFLQFVWFRSVGGMTCIGFEWICRLYFLKPMQTLGNPYWNLLEPMSFTDGRPRLARSSHGLTLTR